MAVSCLSFQQRCKIFYNLLESLLSNSVIHHLSLSKKNYEFPHGIRWLIYAFPVHVFHSIEFICQCDLGIFCCFWYFLSVFFIFILPLQCKLWSIIQSEILLQHLSRGILTLFVIKQKKFQSCNIMNCVNDGDNPRNENALKSKLNNILYILVQWCTKCKEHNSLSFKCTKLRFCCLMVTAYSSAVVNMPLSLCLTCDITMKNRMIKFHYPSCLPSLSDCS